MTDDLDSLVKIWPVTGLSIRAGDRVVARARIPRTRSRTRMRVLMLHLLFAGLGAEEITSSAMQDNPASNAVSLKSGYEPDGVRRAASEGRPVRLNRWRITRERWESLRDEHARILGAPVEMRGVEAVRAQLDPPPEQAAPGPL